MDRINILNKQGMLTDAERKESLVRSFRYVTFDTNLDLSKPVRVTSNISNRKVTASNYSNDLASFISCWTHFVSKYLNGFSGFGRVSFELNIELV